MTKAELDDLLTRAEPHIGKYLPIKEYDKTEKKNIDVLYQFLSTAHWGVGEGKNISYTAVGKLKSPTGKIITESLIKIVTYFEAEGG